MQVGNEGGQPRAAGHDWRLVPLAAAAWSASWIATTGWRPDPGPLLAMVVGLGLIALVAARLGRMWTCVVVVVFTVTGLTSGVQAWQRHSSPVAAFAEAGAVGTVRIRILAEPQQTAEAVVARARLVWVEARGRRVEAAVPVVVLASGRNGTALVESVPGAEYLARVRMGEPRPDDSAVAVLSLRELLDMVRAPHLFDAGATAMRHGLREAVAQSPPRQAALVPSLVVGDTSGVDDEMRDQFQVTGLTHLMAVSGANLTLMLGVVLAAVRAVGLRGWWVRAAAVGGVAAFVLVCGQEPSVLRATAMGLVALAAVGVGTGGRSMRALSVAILALTWLDPWLARSAGFALSVTACAGIVLLGPSLVRALTRWAPRWAAEAIAVPMAAQLATQPIVTGISDQVSMVGVITNALAGPFVGPTTVLGLAAALLCWAPALAAGPGWLAGWCAQPILWLAEGGAALPSAAWDWEASAAGMLVVMVAVAALAMLLPSLLRTPLGAASVVMVLLVSCLVRPTPPGWPGDWGVVFCDVGQGDATVFAAQTGAVVLVDAGPDAGPTVGCLSALGVGAVPLLVLTHWHADHTGGAEEVLARFRPRMVLVRAGEPPGWLVAAAEGSGSELRVAMPGESIAVGEATWTTVSVGAASALAAGAAEEGRDGVGDGSAENDASVVGVAEVRAASGVGRDESSGLRVLLAGDAEPAGQARALRSAALLGLDLSADVLKLPHHGSARQEPRFFAASGASLAVASAGADNDYGHPAKAALDLAAANGMAVARTDTQGTILVARHEYALRITTERNS